MKKRKDIYIILFLTTFIIFFLLPLLLQKEKVFRDDGAYQAFLRLNIVAKYLQKGEIPLWNPNTFCGAKPFYSMYEGPIYNVLLYPFLFFANTNNETKSFFTLMILPFTLALIIAAIGSYLFARFILKLTYIPSFFLGIIYALNPSMVILIISLHNTFIFAFIPWVLLFTIKFLEKPSLKWWLLSIFALIFLSISTNFNYVLRVYFFCTLVVVLFFLFYMEKNLKSVLRVVHIYIAFLFSIGLVAFMWFGILEGILWIKDTGKITFDFIAEEKMNFGNIISIFIPNFTGLLHGKYAWGEAMMSNTNYILLGGLYLSFSALIAIYFLFKKNFQNKTIKCWIIISLITLILTILTMLSDRTPFLKIMATLLPPFFKIPYPHYYHFLQHWSMATLGVLGFSILLKEDIKNDLRKILFIFFSFLIITILISLFEKTDFQGNIVYSYKTIKYLGRLKWFLIEPVLYIFLYLSFLITSLFNKKNLYKIVLPIGLLVEITFFSYIACYKGEISAIAPWGSEPNDECFSTRYFGPKDQPYYKYLINKKDLLEKNFRFTGTITYIDNFSWLLGNYSLFGYDTKPVIKSIYNVMTNFMEGYPYQMVPMEYPLPFLKNMNVRYIIPKLYGKTEFIYKIKKIDDYEYPVLIINEERNPNYEESKIFEIENYLPYIYTQDSIKIADEKEQFDALIKKDLYCCAYVNENKINNIKTLLSINKENSYQNFIELQNKNKILKLDRSFANRLNLEIEINKPSLLIRTEVFHPGWNAKVDGKKVDVFTVNYFQQAIFLKEGKHVVEFYFFPPSLKYGLYVSLFFGLILVGIIIFIIIKKNSFVHLFPDTTKLSKIPKASLL